MHGIIVHTAGEPAVGISVTNGRAVTKTDETGRFALPDEGRFVVITRPTGFTASPWWLPAPGGSDGTAEIGLRFELVPETQTLPYRFLHLTDTHMTVPRSDEETDELAFGLYREGSLPGQITDFLRSLPERAPDAQAVFITGDLVDHGLAEEYEAYLEALTASPVPVHVIPGNHDHMNGHHGSLISRNDYLTNTGTPELYEKYLGPRWYSFDVAGLHVVTLDWHTHELGLDHEEQNAWVKADLAQLPFGSPWILLFHDQPNFSIVDELPWQPVAAFSGHWHTSRVVQVGDTLHVNSPTTFFASLDYSPPAFRTVTWDGENITLQTETLLTVAEPDALGDVSRSTFAASSSPSAHPSIVWRSELAGAGHRQPVSIDAGVVFAGGQVEDRAAGSVEALDLATGELLWRTATGSAVKTTPAPAEDVVIAAEVSGDVSAFDRTTGALVWKVPSSDPLRRFAWGAPTVAGGLVYLGDQSDLRAIDVATGDVVWRRTDLSPHHNLVNHSAPLVIDGSLLVMGFWPTPAHPIGLDALTGESVWATAELNRDDPFAALKRLLIMGTAAYDSSNDSVLMPAFGHTTRVDRATGETVWVSAHEGGFSPATPVVTEEGIVVTVTGHGIRMLDRETGETVWDRRIDGEAPFPMASYTKTPHPVIAAPAVVEGADRRELLLPGLDGVVRRISLDGSVIGSAQLASPFAATLVDAGDLVIAVGTDGNVVALDRAVAS
ncbi:outer membrane protein assembly factor BamB family protein [Herbiconiux ginsengi]|uniref:Outer membrane protein assembly factor BamB, contains PQQ-like beta-propeller repeat n=1 Tax=Herbiconiux ginsengi TaxID=381665 RepID=A0A1H3KJX2_9MICO|nr:PQQ-binding-like beta-propeller repeat protein [Herbiconiux ginsengi]SDY52443.1 Outer membrane protein assembly factor BamB, contains PQQ-like beta-propeller repeat [Herbiconiux ginsengi]